MLNPSWLYFLKVVELGTFSAAAHHYRVRQSTVSAAIPEVESELGLTLIDRGPGRRKLRLTAAGIHIHREIQRLSAQWDQLLRRDLKSVKAPLKIACAQHLGTKYLVPLLDSTAFAGFNPQIYLLPRRSFLEAALVGGQFRAGRTARALVGNGAR